MKLFYNDINELGKKMKNDEQDNIKEYLSKYRKITKNFESIFIDFFKLIYEFDKK